jgi:hypothetical protein
MEKLLIMEFRNLSDMVKVAKEIALNRPSDFFVDVRRVWRPDTHQHEVCVVAEACVYSPRVVRTVIPVADRGPGEIQTLIEKTMTALLEKDFPTYRGRIYLEE